MTRVEAQSRAIRDLVITDDSKSVQIGRISSIAVAATGEIAVADFGENHVLLFDRSGQLIRRFGRVGSGPGEFRYIVDIGFRGDSIWAADLTLLRVSVFSIKDNGVRVATSNLSLDPRRPMLRPLGLLADGSILAASAARPGETKPKEVFFLRKQGDSPLDTIFRYQTPRDWELPSTKLEASAGPRLDQPFEVDTKFRFSPIANATLTVTSRPTHNAKNQALIDVGLRGFDQQMVYQRTMAVQVLPVPTAAVDSALGVARMVRKLPVAELRRTLVVPPRMPPVAKVFMSAKGEAFIRLQPSGPVTTWIWLNARGDSIRSVTTPQKFRAMAAGPGSLVGIEMDDDDVPSIVRYRFD